MRTTHHLIAFIIALILMGTAFLSSANAQIGGTCPSDCPFSLFFTQTQFVTLSGGCVVKVTYSFRNTCNGYYEIRILQIQALTAGCSTSSIASLIKQATEGVMQLDSMHFPIYRDSCVSKWRVYKASCWRKDSISVDSVLIIPCTPSGCCTTNYTVCDTNGVTRFIQEDSKSTDDSCTGVGCTNVCGYGQTFTKEAMRHTMEEFAAAGIQTSGAAPNPTDGSTTISFTVPDPTHVVMGVYDAAGRQVALLLDKECAAGAQQVRFDGAGLPNGTYLYRISGAGSVAIGKIILAH